MRARRLLMFLALGAGRALAAGTIDVGPGPLPWVVGGQTTVVWQYHPAFRSPYAGPHSLRGEAEDAVSHSYGLYAGVRVLPWLELFAEPEMIRGGGISEGRGLAAYTNGEVIRNPAAGESPYLARAFLRATLPLGEERERVDGDFFQTPGSKPTRRLVATAGVLATTDLFETNRYASSTRTQFLNWSFISDLAYDFAADTRGYTRGVALEWIDERFAVRAGSFQMPAVANGLALDDDLLRSHSDQLEVETAPVAVRARPVNVKMTLWENRARMGEYRAALARAARTDTVPSVATTRGPGRVKYGVALNLEHPLDDGASGLFGRLGWNDGGTESFAYTEADWAAALGAQIGGDHWQRPDDRCGIAVGADGLSEGHAHYLARGGLGFQLGDGRLSYRPEAVVETYYLLAAVPHVGLTLDYQLVVDPGHNADRGPASVVALRLHAELAASGG